MFLFPNKALSLSLSLSLSLTLSLCYVTVIDNQVTVQQCPGGTPGGRATQEKGVERGTVPEKAWTVTSGREALGVEGNVLGDECGNEEVAVGGV